nr:hypothetical protein Iba_chr14aCG8320 [Ipomoea batatas]
MEKNKREKRTGMTNNNGSKGSAGSPAEAKTKSEVSLSNGGQTNASAEHRRANGGDDSSGEEEEYGGEKSGNAANLAASLAILPIRVEEAVVKMADGQRKGKKLVLPLVTALDGDVGVEGEIEADGESEYVEGEI